MKIKKEDLTFEANSIGYTIKYKGHSIGGAGSGVRSRFYKRRQLDRKMYAEMAKREVDALINGSGGKHLFDAIIELSADLKP